MSLYRSLIIALIGAIVIGVQSALAGDNRIGTDEAIQIAIAVVTAFTVWNTANTTGWRYAKPIAAAVLAVLSGLTSILTNGFTNSEVINLIIAGLVAAGVLMVPNRPPVTAQQD